MDGQGRIGATGSGGRLTGNKPSNAAYKAAHAQANFTSFLGRPGATGFTSNQRPAIYYRPSLDLTDNPQFVLLLSDTFMSQTQRHFQPHVRSGCSLPNLRKNPRESGFLQLRNHHNTQTLDEKTEYQRLFVPHRLQPTVSSLTQNFVVVGPRQSGFTEGTDLQFNTFQDKHCTVDPQQPHSSVMKKDFLTPSLLQGTEARAGLCSRSSRDTGFTRGAVAPLACPASLLPSPPTKSNAATEKTIGKKEPTGSLLNAPNNEAFPKTPFDGSHFTTHYANTFFNPAGFEKQRFGQTCGKMDNGYNRRDMDRFIFRG